MGKAIFGFILLVHLNVLYGQEEGGLSAEIDANYYYHFIGKNTTKLFNHGFSFLISKKFNTLKISSGINYSTKNYYIDIEEDNFSIYPERKEYRLQYFNIPLFITSNNQKNTFGINPLVGIIFHKHIKYKLISYYSDSPKVMENMDLNKTLGISFRFGIDLSKSLNNHIILHASPFSDFKVKLNSKEESRNTRGVPDNRITVGMKVGVEYVFN